MHWMEHNRMTSERTQQIKELKSAYHAMLYRSTSPTANIRQRRRCRELAERARRSLVRMGVTDVHDPRF